MEVSKAISTSIPFSYKPTDNHKQLSRIHAAGVRPMPHSSQPRISVSYQRIVNTKIRSQGRAGEEKNID
ncbi:hypothetical protein DVJ77_10225 [Dyella tabacisoli]|uniref:Uncharacterized protein n=1 Tax=Dyella tabacisoli TaxID=2282381 RepID=A0A369ULT0_9GAMM|nr:hypothetical protein DVJ77_10225 [Dyella tabacisoli]